MRTLFVLLASLVVLATAQAQVQFGVKAGIAPTRTMGTAPLLVNRNDPTADFLFNGQRVEYSPSLGLVLRLNKERFFFEGEANYYSIRKSYAMQYLDGGNYSEASHPMDESCKSIELPISLGVKIGHFEVTSGLSGRYEFGQKSSLTEMPNSRREVNELTFGFHGSVGLSFGKVFAQLRYQQEFMNYGQGIFVNDQELLLRNSPSQLRFAAGIWF